MGLPGFWKKKLTAYPNVYKNYALFKGGELSGDIRELKKIIPPKDFSEGVNEKDFLKGIVMSAAKLADAKIDPDQLGRDFSLDAMDPFKDASGMREFIESNKGVIQEREKLSDATRVKLTLLIFRNIVKMNKELVTPKVPVEAKKDVEKGKDYRPVWRCGDSG